MKREDLFAAINDIRDEFIEEANPDHAVRRETSHRLRPWLGMAAMLGCGNWHCVIGWKERSLEREV